MINLEKRSKVENMKVISQKIMIWIKIKKKQNYKTIIQ